MNNLGAMIYSWVKFSLRTYVGVLVLLQVFSLATVAQSTFTNRYTAPGLAPGAPLGSQSISDLEHLNYFNGNLSVMVPLQQIGGRGEVGDLISLIVEQHWRINKTILPPPSAGTIRSPALPLYKPVGYSPGFLEAITVLGPPVGCGEGNTNYPSLLKLAFTT